MQLFNRLYPTAMMLCAATAIVLPAQTYTTLFTFGGTNGASPAAALVQGTDGHLYGTTVQGGINPETSPCGPAAGCGTVFKITPNGTLTMLYSFCSFNLCPDGAAPNAALVQTASGDFYGTTSGGGSSSSCAPVFYYGYYVPGCGTVFKITPSGSLTTIYNFCSETACADGAHPMAGLVPGSNGVLYGTTSFGGVNNGGTIFKITPAGNLTTLYSFCSLSGCADGQNPSGALVQAANGALYGTTPNGGSSPYCGSVLPFLSGCGTVFKVTPSGAFTSVYSFCAQSGCADGASPNAGLVQATNGRFYGTTAGGGNSESCSDCGTVFKITSSGALTTLHSFTGRNDGGNPNSSLIQASDGNLYGTSQFLFPTIFKITPAGSLTTVSGFPTGVEYSSALIQDTNGSLYGTTSYGGPVNATCTFLCGTIYSLSIGLGPFIQFQPASGPVGHTVEIVGNSLTGATGVSFNGTRATFKVVSNTLIKADVPSGATTGKVQVTTPGGTLVSDVNFRVHP